MFTFFIKLFFAKLYSIAQINFNLIVSNLDVLQLTCTLLQNVGVDH